MRGVADRRRGPVRGRYTEDDVTRLRVTRAAARLGFTLAEIRELLDVGVHRHGAADLHTRIEEKLAEVRRCPIPFPRLAGHRS